MSAPWSIEPIPLYRFSTPGPEVLFQRAFGEMIEMVIYAFLLRSGERTVLIDTGLPDDYRALNESIITRKGPAAGFFSLGDGLLTELAIRGASPDLIVVTSFGPYAVGGLEHLGERPLVVSGRGLADLEEPEEPALVHASPDHLKALLRRGQGIEGRSEIAPGITIIETGIHHPASLAAVIDTGNGRIAIADPVFAARNLREGIALGAAEHAAGWHAMVRMLGRECDAILPIHDVSPAPLPKSAWHPSTRSAPER